MSINGCSHGEACCSFHTLGALTHALSAWQLGAERQILTPHISNTVPLSTTDTCRVMIQIGHKSFLIKDPLCLLKTINKNSLNEGVLSNMIWCTFDK